MELWKAIEDCPNYEVSNLGRVRSIDHTHLASDGRFFHRKGRVLRNGVSKRLGYAIVVIADASGKFKTRYVHLLVAAAYLPPRPTPAHEINHKNGVKSESCADNLEWATHQENMQHSINSGLRKVFAFTNPWTGVSERRLNSND
jgi:hypothetical protein